MQTPIFRDELETLQDNAIVNEALPEGTRKGALKVDCRVPTMVSATTWTASSRLLLSGVMCVWIFQSKGRPWPTGRSIRNWTANFNRLPKLSFV